jgi:cobalt/nickel transport system permease protein
MRADSPTVARSFARLGFVALCIWVGVVIATPLGRWFLVGAEFALVIVACALAGIPPRALIQKWVAALLPLSLFSILLAWNHPDALVLGRTGVALALVAKSGLATLAVLAWTIATPWREILAALRWFRVPAFFVSTLHFLERYRWVLGDESHRLTIARRARSIGRRRINWRLPAAHVAALLIRSLERGDRVAAAMLARGWDGTPNGLDSIWVRR